MEIYSPRLAGFVALLTVLSWLITAASLTPTPAEVVTKIAGDTVFMGMGLAARSCPVATAITCTSAVPVVGAFQGITKLICVGRSNGLAEVVPNWMPPGKMLAMVLGPSGLLAWKLAALMADSAGEEKGTRFKASTT